MNTKANTADTKRKPVTWLKDILQVLGLPVIVLLIFTFALALANVDGDSMSPLYNSDTILIASRLTKPDRSDIVLVKSNAIDEEIVKRVIALPGDTLEIIDSVVYLNDEILEEPYVQYVGGPDIGKITVPDDMVFVMGDNRPISLDSRNPMLGLIPDTEIVGTVILSFQSPIHMDFIKSLKS